MEKSTSTQKLLVITSYPEKGFLHGQLTVGIASYSKNTLLSLIKVSKKYNHKLDITVLAEKFQSLSQKNNEYYLEDGMKIQRIWKRNSPTVFLTIFKFATASKAKKVLIEFELSMFGGLYTLIMFPFFLFLLKLNGKEIHIVLHQVIDDIGELSAHINLPRKSVKTKLLNIGIRFFYRLSLLPVKKIIVFEEALKEKVACFTSEKKIVVIPHGVESFNKKNSLSESRRKLKITNDFVIVCFGYLAWYKGTDWILKEFHKKVNENLDLLLIIAGGPNPNHTKKTYYNKYVKGLYDTAKDFPNNIKITGFIPEKDIELYYQAADLILLPYRTLMSSSGPLSIALSFDKPFLISDKLKDLLKTNDLKNILITLELKPENLFFSMEKNEIIEKINKYKQKKDELSKLTLLSKGLHQAREFTTIGEKYLKELNL